MSALPTWASDSIALLHRIKDNPPQYWTPKAHAWADSERRKVFKGADAGALRLIYERAYDEAITAWSGNFTAREQIIKSFALDADKLIEAVLDGDVQLPKALEPIEFIVRADGSARWAA